jgi:Fur family transcriptional regulator, zinc uptake regulator
MISCNDHKKYVELSLERAENICRELNVRFTKLRKKILLIMLRDHKSNKAYEILEILKKEDPSAKPATVYRALNFLLEYGLIHKLNILNSYVICSHPLESQKCSFLICNKCNNVSEYCENNLVHELELAANKNNFNIIDAAVEIRGICKECSA